MLFLKGQQVVQQQQQQQQQQSQQAAQQQQVQQHQQQQASNYQAVISQATGPPTSNQNHAWSPQGSRLSLQQQQNPMLNAQLTVCIFSVIIWIFHCIDKMS